MTQKKFSGGPGTARKRILSALDKVPGISIVHKSPFDVELGFIGVSKHSKPKVLRLDGCYYRNKQLRLNREIRRSMKMSDFVVFQSHFSKTMCERILGITKPSCIIHNGIDLDMIDGVTADPTIEAGSFVACASWRMNKRPKSIIKGFLKADTGRHLYLIGDGLESFKVADENVHFLGVLDHKKVVSVMKSCSYLIHLCHIDSCPNVVIEGLACGLPVLHTNLGGTREIVGTDGVMLTTDYWDFAVSEFGELDNLNSDSVADGIRKIMSSKFSIDRSRLDIKMAAMQYAGVLKQCS